MVRLSEHAGGQEDLSGCLYHSHSVVSAIVNAKHLVASAGKKMGTPVNTKPSPESVTLSMEDNSGMQLHSRPQPVAVKLNPIEIDSCSKFTEPVLRHAFFLLNLSICYHDIISVPAPQYQTVRTKTNYDSDTELVSQSRPHHTCNSAEVYSHHVWVMLD